ncbi:hypothetical protein INS49_008820 [Diaporthe citri]|uniref:uncharacterized protein n=1 Tax=Diaporthe citri TaxID=83186 RepID=UPI001C7F6A1B|nr:uncharacterized protein INS49_008820 [Diaporthe citri]KAG6363717.1 hypothetical protein INS49_008820 [Diaporthe citri]
MDAVLIARQAAPTATPFPFPFQHTKMDLDWAVFMYIFVFCVFVGTILLGRIITCSTWQHRMGQGVPGVQDTTGHPPLKTGTRYKFGRVRLVYMNGLISLINITRRTARVISGMVYMGFI